MERENKLWLLSTSKTLKEENLLRNFNIQKSIFRMYVRYRKQVKCHQVRDIINH